MFSFLITFSKYIKVFKSNMKPKYTIMVMFNAKIQLWKQCLSADLFYDDLRNVNNQYKKCLNTS